MSKAQEEIVVEKEIKYHLKIAAIEKAINGNCIGATYQEKDTDAYRWTFEDISDERNFRPRALDSQNPQQEKTAKKCTGWSLSFFDSQKNAIEKLNYYCADKPNFYKKLGTHVAKGKIEKTDGKSGDINTSGHFEHFEYKDVDFSKKFKVEFKIYNE